MIVQRSVIEMYIDFIDKTLGNKRGYTSTQKQEILANFSQMEVSDLENLRTHLRDILKSGQKIDDFPIEDTRKFLSNISKKEDQRQLYRIHRELADNLLIVPDYLHKSIFALMKVMYYFKQKYPAIVNFEDFGWALKRLISSLF